MKNATQKLAVILLIMMSTACTKAQPPKENLEKITGKNILIVYLSRTNNTKAVAEMIHQHVGGTITAIEVLKPYPADYKTTVDQVAKENESGFLPPLKTRIDNIKKYDMVFVGFPTWGMQLPPPMKSFLNEYDLSGKTIIPFNTNAGYGIGSSFETVKKLCPNSRVLEGFTVKGGVERDGELFVMEGDKAKSVSTKLVRWLENINITRKQE
ncbi:flavodoxin [Pedobacter sp. CAN_A7]|uniref:flavodoxin n=1 Tax=Pedobacter sp. CAN_A7 TaxID=2787722 RepID=UPI0018CA52E0